MRNLGLLGVLALAAGLTLTSCTGDGGDFGTVSFRCDATQSANRECPESYRCCSDDPSTIDGQRLFSGFNNDLSNSGMCVQEGALPVGSGLSEAPDCPVPCNPTWDAAEVTAVCGASRMCCQTAEVTEADCVFDTTENRWRAADARDAEAAAASGLPWGRPDGTHQDPNFQTCSNIVGGNTADPLFAQCIQRLTVANQRGYCLQAAPGGCPTASPSYLDACEALNG